MNPRYAVRNALHTLALLAAMGLLLFGVATTLLGPWGAMVVGGLAVVTLAMVPRISAAWMAQRMGAHPTHPLHVPWLHSAVVTLAERAGLPHTPTLHVLPSPMLQAMALGTADDGAIVVTTGLLRRIGRRELLGVLAHEISHLRHGDTSVMRIASVVSEMTRWLARVGLLAVLLTVPLLLLGIAEVSLLAVVLLLLTPPTTQLLWTGLSRSREFDADASAAELTGDPMGLAHALAELERFYNSSWVRWLNPLARPQVPAWLRTHPDTHERIARLKAMAPTVNHRPVPDPLPYRPRTGVRRIIVHA
ncbi:MAG: zinc metalloprotease HtpX [Myxococcota bacterium]